MRFTSAKTEDNFLEDVKLQFAVIHAFEVLGEAAKRISDIPASAEPPLAALPLREVYAIRNRLIHGYDTLDLETVWEISTTDTPKLKQDLEALVASWPKDAS